MAKLNEIFSGIQITEKEKRKLENAEFDITLPFDKLGEEILTFLSQEDADAPYIDYLTGEVFEKTTLQLKVVTSNGHLIKDLESYAATQQIKEMEIDEIYTDELEIIQSVIGTIMQVEQHLINIHTQPNQLKSALTELPQKLVDTFIKPLLDI